MPDQYNWVPTAIGIDVDLNFVKVKELVTQKWIIWPRQLTLELIFNLFYKCVYDLDFRALVKFFYWLTFDIFLYHFQ